MTNTYDRVKQLLAEIPDARDLKNRKRLEWLYWRKFDGIKETMTKEEYLRTTPVETIDRAWRKVMEVEYPTLPREERDNRELEMRNEIEMINVEEEVKRKDYDINRGMEIIREKIKDKLPLKRKI